MLTPLARKILEICPSPKSGRTVLKQDLRKVRNDPGKDQDIEYVLSKLLADGHITCLPPLSALNFGKNEDDGNRCSRTVKGDKALEASIRSAQSHH
ncbi:MAG: hypothetical protein KBC15_04100 [Candidatus Levybacteria bacterium]|nr:hypothetical protein [Candidatus Levybacteria bacterium]